MAKIREIEHLMQANVKHFQSLSLCMMVSVGIFLSVHVGFCNCLTTILYIIGLSRNFHHLIGKLLV